jgi:hypothetical protein
VLKELIGRVILGRQELKILGNAIAGQRLAQKMFGECVLAIRLRKQKFAAIT